MQNSDTPLTTEDAMERPTTFQLAQLAAILGTRPDSVKISPSEVVLEALQLWEASGKVNLAERQQREIWNALYSDSQERWEHRLKAYIGDKLVLHELLSESRFQIENEILPNLFPGDHETVGSRRAKFTELLRYAQEHRFFYPSATGFHTEFQGEEPDEGARQLQGSSDGEDLLAGKFNAVAVRMLVEAQQDKAATAERGL